MGKPRGESRGLEFLRQARPAAMEHLLAFFAESARHLDPKTRFLISVVTKVISGSERGIQQYVKRALEAGASPQEVLDAVLCAYPCAGLTKVVDAVDTILDMGIEGLAAPAATASTAEGAAPVEPTPPPPAPAAPPPRAARPPPPPAVEKAAPEPVAEELDWVSAGEVADIPPICGRRVIAGLADVAVFSVEGKVMAVENRCPHRGGSLAEGVVVDGVVICPLHQWRFDLRTGQCPDRPRAAVRTFPVRVEGNRVLVGVARETAQEPDRAPQT